VLLLALVPLAPLFNKWSRADTRLLDKIGGKLGREVSSDKPINATDLLFLTGRSCPVADRVMTTVQIFPLINKKTRNG
jgi:uncharacterized membrane protein